MFWRFRCLHLLFVFCLLQLLLVLCDIPGVYTILHYTTTILHYTTLYLFIHLEERILLALLFLSLFLFISFRILQGGEGGKGKNRTRRSVGQSINRSINRSSNQSTEQQPTYLWSSWYPPLAGYGGVLNVDDYQGVFVGRGRGRGK